MNIVVYNFNNMLQKTFQNVTVDILIPPSFVKIPTNQVCPNGRTARFECQAQGLPVPKIYWLKDSLNITINGKVIHYNIYLYLYYNTYNLYINCFCRT